MLRPMSWHCQISPNKPLVPTRKSEALCSRHSGGVGLRGPKEVKPRTVAKLWFVVQLLRYLWAEIKAGHWASVACGFISSCQ
jgi:hypothetical protein